VLAFYARVSQLQSRMKVQGRATDKGDEGGRRYAENGRVYESYEMRASAIWGILPTCDHASVRVATELCAMINRSRRHVTQVWSYRDPPNASRYRKC
jgi:hypothetical protein